MKNTYSSLVDCAYSRVIRVNENYLNGNTMVYPVLILGVGNYLVEGAIGSGHNYQAVLDAVHLFAKDYPDLNADIGFKEGILSVINNNLNFSKVRLLFNYIVYEMKKEKEKSNSFSLDCQELLSALRKGIADNYTYLKSDYSGIDAWLNKSELYVKENYGYCF